MKKMLFLIFMLVSFFLFSNEYNYIPDPNPLIKKKIKKWQNLKFGLLMHWGTYSVWGIVESWSLSPEDYDWCKRKRGKFPNNYFLYKKEYESLKKVFNPVKFNPDKWAKAAKQAGMKYVIFTTKHHDGFCMYDSKYTDYKITAKDCPFSKNKRADITKEIFKSFRKEGFWVGAYFSKPDWHSKYYWNPYFPPFDRNVNYDPALYPKLWNKFVHYTHNQILELMKNYGKIDILWLDGGWVAKRSKKEIKNFYKEQISKTKTGFIKQRIVSQDIRMNELVKKVRKLQPDIIVVDRAVKGKNQNYLTPENTVPDNIIPYPWESCIPMSQSWSYVKNPQYKSSEKIIKLLIDIVSKGGNLLLNIAPSPEGDWDQQAYKILNEIGLWIKEYGEAIYGTKPFTIYGFDNIRFTQKEKTVYIFYIPKKDRKTNLISLKKIFTEKNKFYLLSGEKLEVFINNGEIIVKIPKEYRDKIFVFKTYL